jgi:hypothetical protein
MTRKDWLAITFLALLVAAFFKDASLLRRTFFYQDISIQNLPCRHFFAEEWKQRRFPLWCPDILGGFPLFAEGQSGAAYPPNLLLYPFLKTWVALNVSVVLHYALAAVGMFLLLRLWAGRWGATLGAMTFALNGWMVGHLAHLNALSAAAWIPWVFYFLERTFRHGQAWTLLLAAATLAMPFLAGHVQVALYACLAAALFSAYRFVIELRERDFKSKIKNQKSKIFRLAVAGGLLFSLTFGLAAIQILPSRELLQHSDRPESQSYDFLTYGSVPPSLLALFVTPHLFGSRANDTHWLSEQLDLPLHEMNFYLGLLPLLLAALALARRRDPPTLFFALILVISALFMLGKFTPFYRIHELLPVFDRLRMPARYAYLLVFSLAGLAGLGLDALIRNPKSQTPNPKNQETPDQIRIPLLVCMAGAVLLPLVLGLWTYRKLPQLPAPQAERLRAEMWVDSARGASFLAISTVLLMMFPATQGPKRIRYLSTMLVVTALDLCSVNRLLNPTIDPAYYEDPPATAQWLLKDRGTVGPGDQGTEIQNPKSKIQNLGSEIGNRKSEIKNPFRLYDFDQSHDPAIPGWRLHWPYFAERERLNGCLPMAYGLSSLDGHLGLYSDRWWAFKHDLSANRLGAMAVRYVVGEPPRDAPWFRKVADTPIPIYENLKAAPRAFLAHTALSLPDPAAFIQTLESPEFDPRTTVLREDPAAPAINPNSQFPIPNSPTPPRPVAFRLDEPDHVVLEVQSEAPAYLVLADTYFTGWEAVLDDQPTPIYRANFLARAVYISPGQHRVEFHYRPFSFRLGATLTFSTIIISILLALLTRRRSCF